MDVKDQVGACSAIGPGGDRGLDGGVVGQAGEVQAERLEAGRAHPAALDRHGAPIVVLVETDEHDFTCPIASDVHQVGCAARAPGNVGGAAGSRLVWATDGQVVHAGAGDLVVARPGKPVDEAHPPAIVGQVRSGKAGGDRQAEFVEGQVAGGARRRIEDHDRTRNAGQRRQVERAIDGRGVQPIVITGQDHRPDPGASQSGET